MHWITVEGIDGSGKTTVGSLIKSHYSVQGKRVLLQVHPSERLLGTLARRSLQAEGPLMYAVSTCFYILDVVNSLFHMRQWRNEYDVVVFVRYIMATAYLPKRMARLAYTFISRVLPTPDHMLLVDIDPAQAVHRMAQRDDKKEMFENLASLTKVREKELWLASEGWSVLDNSGTPEEMHEKLQFVLDQWGRSSPGKGGPQDW
jgi:dTMP kinase